MDKQVVKAPQLTDRQQYIYECWINPAFRYLTVSCGRQVGKSHIALMIAIKTALTPSIMDLSLKKCKVGFFMPYNDGAREMYERAKEFVEGQLSGLKTNSTNKTIQFNNGSVIRFFGTENGKSIRGKFFDFIIVDEACFVKDDVWQASITATLSRARQNGWGKVLLTSTPKEKNWFYDYFVKEDDKYKSIKFTSYESGLHSKEYLDEIKSMTPVSIFANEYLAEFQEGSRGMFELNRIEFTTTSSFKDKLGVTAAVDWGMENDYTVLVILNTNKEVIYINRWRKLPWHTLIETISIELRAYNSPLCYAETNGIGNMPTDELRRIYGATREFNTGSNKQEMILKLSKDLLMPTGKSKLKLPDIDYVREEFENFGFNYDNGRMKFSNLKSDVHDDTVMAIAIANYNFKTFGLSF